MLKRFIALILKFILINFGLVFGKQDKNYLQT